MARRVQLSSVSLPSSVSSISVIRTSLIITLSILILLESFGLGEKGRDIIIRNGQIILKGGKKKGNIIISHGGGASYGDQGKYKYKKKYMDYGGYWR